MQTIRNPIVVGISCLVIAMSATWAAATSAADQEPPRIAFLVRGDNPVDAFAASSVAGQVGGVVLLTDQDHLSDSAEQGLTSAKPDLVVLSGGEVALSEQVRSDVEALGFEARRIGGKTRQETAQQISAVLKELGIGRPVLTGVPVSGGVDFGRATVSGLPFATEVVFVSSPLAGPQPCGDFWAIPDASIDGTCEATNTSNPDRHFWTQRISGADFPPDVVLHVEYRGKADPDNTVCGRLYDLTADQSVADSEACHTISGSQKTFSMDSSPITLPDAEHDYVLELRTQGTMNGHVSVGVVAVKASAP